MTIIIFIFLLVVLILVHEFGHFACAKLFGIRVDEFGIFFPPRLFAKKYGETEYSLNALPFGGFVRIYGESENETGLRSFVSKSRWIQAAVIVAGIVMNIVFAWLALSVGYMVGLPTAVDHDGFGTVTNASAMIVSILPQSPAQTAGLLSGDVVEALETGDAKLNTKTLNTSQQSDVVRQFIKDHENESIVITVLRNNQEKTFLAKPVAGLVQDRKALGIELEDVGTLKLSPPLAVVQGAILTKNLTVLTAQGLVGFFGSLVRGVANWSGVAGPIGIVSVGSQVVSEGFSQAVSLIATISISLAIFNVIPIPGLDGGRLLFIIIEGIRGKAISRKFSVGLTIAGFALLIALMLVVSYHDIAKLVG
jgi:regulator of sigma E protease